MMALILGRGTRILGRGTRLVRLQDTAASVVASWRRELTPSFW
jgi:hypothetical protein